MSGFFDDFIAQTEPESKEFCVEVTNSLRLWFRIDGDFGQMTERESSVRAQFDAFAKYKEGKFSHYEGMHPSWPKPSAPIVLFNALNLKSSLARGESLIGEEWAEKPVEIPDLIKLASRGAVFKEVLNRVATGMHKHIAQGEDEALEAAKKKSTATKGTSGTSE